jgi:hypothetical protein
MRMVVGLVLGIAVANPLFAADPASVVDRFPRALGVQVGRIAGIGISYQKWQDDTGFQVAAAGMYHPLMDDGHDVLNYNAGVEFQYLVYTDDFANWLSGRLYLFAGLNHRGYIEAVLIAPDTYAVGDFHPEFGLGGGVGVEAVLFEHFAVVTEMVYALFWNPIQPVLHEQFMVEILPQISLRYRY